MARMGLRKFAVVAVSSILALLQVGTLLSAAWEKSDTADETRYVASAASLWAHENPRDLCEAPALPKRGFGLALWAMNAPLEDVPLGWQGAADALITGEPATGLRQVFFAARCATIAVVVVAGFFVFAVGHRFGVVSAIVSQVLWCASPTLLANGSLAALDAWAAALMAVVAWAGARLLERATPARAFVLGMACGGAACTKITTLLVAPIVLLLVLRSSPPAERRPTGRLLALCSIAALVTIWAIYGFTVGGVDLMDPCPFAITDRSPVHGWLPFPAWFEGLVFQVRHGQVGHPSYLFGQVSMQGWWWFYLACLALKVPVGTQGLAALGVASTFIRTRRLGPASLGLDALLLIYPVALLIFMSLGSHQANVSFLLPALPFTCVWIGRATSEATHIFARTGPILLSALVLVAVAESLRVHPHYLMFFNVWAGGPDGGARYLVHREDWGQDKRLLAEWQRENGIPELYYAPYGPNASEWGIVYSPVPCTPTAGVYALHAVEVHRPQFGLTPGCVDWLTVEEPDVRLGHTIYIYIVDEQRLRRLSQPHQGTVFWKSGS